MFDLRSRHVKDYGDEFHDSLLVDDSQDITNVSSLLDHELNTTSNTLTMSDEDISASPAILADDSTLMSRVFPWWGGTPGIPPH